ncbi:uncharacterized protein TNCV_4653131 [Trichonephila clavipes]|nr:uncharacterized protein TNCV_4653131 [Trichonephila clavipes]
MDLESSLGGWPEYPALSSNNLISVGPQCLWKSRTPQLFQVTPEEKDQVKVETNLLHRHIQLFSQHSAHKTSLVKQYFVKEFGKQIIGYGGIENWPKRLPNLTPLDFFLCGCLKQQVYATPP